MNILDHMQPRSSWMLEFDGNSYPCLIRPGKTKLAYGIVTTSPMWDDNKEVHVKLIDRNENVLRRWTFQHAAIVNDQLIYSSVKITG